MACHTVQMKKYVICRVVYRQADGLSYRANGEICDLHGSVSNSGWIVIQILENMGVTV